MDSSDKTRAIVLKAIRYGDNSLIVKLLTEQNGLQSFMVKGAYNKTAKIRAALFQPLTLLDVVCAKSRGELGYLKEASVEFAYQDIPINIIKNSIVLFISELLSKTIQEAEPDYEMFSFVYQALRHLDDKKDNCADIPLMFATAMTGFLGFAPNTNSYQEGFVFDLMEGCFRHDSTGCIYYIDNQLSTSLYQICNNDYFAEKNLKLTNAERRQLLEAVINYYKLHVSGFNELKSIEILKAVLSANS